MRADGHMRQSRADAGQGKIQRTFEFRVRLWLSRMRRLIEGSGFRVQGSGFRVQGSGFRVEG